MTVKELIEKLREYPEDMEVVTSKATYCDGDYEPEIVTNVEVAEVVEHRYSYNNKRWHFEYRAHTLDETDKASNLRNERVAVVLQ